MRKSLSCLLLAALLLSFHVARAVGELKKPGQFFVGFAAETERLADHARAKLEKKHLDMIVANDVSRPGAGFDVDTNIISIITAEATRDYPMMSKKDAAQRILDSILSERANNNGGSPCTPR